MKFPCKVEVQRTTSSFLPPGTYTAVGRMGKFIVVEYHLGWRFIQNLPSFCKEDGKYANVHEGSVVAHGKQKNGRPVTKNWKDMDALNS